MPATAGGSTSGSSTSVTTSARPRKRRVAIRYAAGVPKARMSTFATTFVFSVTTSASTRGVVAELREQLAGRHPQEDGRDRQEQEAERDDAVAPTSATANGAAHGTPKPARRELARARRVLEEVGDELERGRSVPRAARTTAIS